MAIQIIQVKSKSDLRKFIYLPDNLHKDHKTWVPPLYTDEWKFLNPKENKALTYSDTILFLAYLDNEVVGRIMGIINKNHNRLNNLKNGRFFLPESINNQEVLHKLISYVEDWAKEKGMDKLVGPLGFSDKDPQGFLIEGFEHRAIIATPCNHKYMVDLMANEGFTKEVDLLDFVIQVPKKVPEVYERIFQRASRKEGFILHEFKKRKELKAYITPVLRLMNESYSHIYGFVPIEEDEMIKLAKQYIPILDPKYVKAITLDDEVVAFAIGIPDFSEGLQKSRGRLFPFGIFKIMKAMKNTDRVNLLLGAVKPKYQNQGLNVVIAAKFFETAIANGIKELESHLILETNTKMLGEVKKVGGKLYKQFRIFKKDLL
ncbi:MAG: hypothetical protein J7K53_06990 [Bacteroidales bacterium]|nr:hypothetical protein [Bacteroidales bacterium]